MGIYYLKYFKPLNKQKTLKYLYKTCKKNSEKALYILKLEAGKGSGEAQYYIGKVLILKGEKKRAINYFEKGLKQNNNKIIKFVKTKSSKEISEFQYLL